MRGIVEVLLALVGVAMVAVVVSKNADTGGVITATGQAFSQSVGAVTAPVSGASFMPRVGVGRA